MELKEAKSFLESIIEEHCRRLSPPYEQFFSENQKQIIRKEKAVLKTVLQALDNSIPKEKIKDKLRYKKNKLSQLENDKYRIMCLQIEIDILQELLEESNRKITK